MSQTNNPGHKHALESPLSPGKRLARNTSRPWMAATFAVLAVAVIAGILLPTVAEPVREEYFRSGFSGVPASSSPVAGSDPVELFRFDSPAINESSGIVPSVRHAGHFWTHNDSGQSQELFLISPVGKLVARVKIEGVEFRDWEAISILEMNGVPHLALGDIGDNALNRESCQIHVIEEPGTLPDAEQDVAAVLAVTPVETIQFSWGEAGPRNCEALAYDQAARCFWLVSKTGQQSLLNRFAGGGSESGAAGVYCLPWPVEGTKPETEIASAVSLETDFSPLLVTGMDISPDGNRAIVRNYWYAFLFDKEPATSWEGRLKQPPSLTLALPPQQQGEAIAFLPPSDAIVITSEGVGQPVWQVPLPDTSESPEQPDQKKK